jgi:hypothetical protein
MNCAKNLQIEFKFWHSWSQRSSPCNSVFSPSLYAIIPYTRLFQQSAFAALDFIPPALSEFAAQITAAKEAISSGKITFKISQVCPHLSFPFFFPWIRSCLFIFLYKIFWGFCFEIFFIQFLLLLVDPKRGGVRGFDPGKQPTRRRVQANRPRARDFRETQQVRANSCGRDFYGARSVTISGSEREMRSP